MPGKLAMQHGKLAQGSYKHVHAPANSNSADLQQQGVNNQSSQKSLI